MNYAEYGLEKKILLFFYMAVDWLLGIILKR